MSVKHVMKYYESLCKDFDEMICNLHETEDACERGIVSSEMLDRVKSTVDIMKTNKGRWDWLIFLLNMPNKKEKRDYYIRQNGKIIDNIRDIALQEDVENKQVITDLQDLNKSITQ